MHALLKTSSGVRYALYSLASTKPEPGGAMPADCAAFLGQPGARDVRLHATDHVSRVGSGRLRIGSGQIAFGRVEFGSVGLSRVGQVKARLHMRFFMRLPYPIFFFAKHRLDWKESYDILFKDTLLSNSC